MLPAALLAALAPAAMDMGKSLFSGIGRAINSRFFPDTAKAQTPAEVVQLQDADTRRLQALAALDTVAGTPSQWVVDLRASTRYVAVLLIVLAVVAVVLLAPVWTVPPAMWDLLAAWGQAAFFFLFGEHVYINTQAKIAQRESK